MSIWKLWVVNEIRYLPLTYDITRIMIASDAFETDDQD